MAHPNEELVRRGYEAFNTGDVETLRQLFADTTIFHEPGRSPISGDYQGLDQVLGFFGTLAERSGGTFGVDPVWWTPKMRALPSRWESDATTTPVLPAGVQG